MGNFLTALKRRHAWIAVTAAFIVVLGTALVVVRNSHNEIQFSPVAEFQVQEAAPALQPEGQDQVAVQALPPETQAQAVAPAQQSQAQNQIAVQALPPEAQEQVAALAPPLDAQTQKLEAQENAAAELAVQLNAQEQAAAQEAAQARQLEAQKEAAERAGQSRARGEFASPQFGFDRAVPLPGLRVPRDAPAFAPQSRLDRAAPQAAPQTDSAVPNHTTVRVFYATDRNQIAGADSAEKFGTDRGPAISFGYCEVSIPRDHRMGELERPSIWRLEFRENPDKHVVLRGTLITSKDAFFANLSDRVRNSQRKSAFVFVHGYNVTFADAARRTAQMSYDLGFDGAPVFYSWPSQGRPSEYIVDEQSVEWAQTNLKTFLDDFFARSDAQNVYVIGHSMGNRALTRAVAALLAEKPEIRSRLKEVILAAPDIDADVFKREIVPALTVGGRLVTLYASSEDVALAASRKVHGDYPRAGETGAGLVVVPGVETIDAARVDTSFLGHSYYGDRSVLSDMFYLITNGTRADMRFGLRPVPAPIGRYWELLP